MPDLLAPPAAPSTILPGAPTVAGALTGGQSNMGFSIHAPDFGLAAMLAGMTLLIGKPRAKFNPNVTGFGDFDGYALPQGYKTVTAAQDTIYGEGGNVCTTVGGTPLYADGNATSNFLGDNGGDPSTWSVGSAGKMVRRLIGLSLTEAQRQQVPCILWVHTETDSQTKNGGTDKNRYKAALRRWFTLMRSWVGKSAAELPVFVALPMPYGPANGGTQRMIRQAMLELATETAFNFHIAIRQTADANPRGNTDYSHIDTDDLRAWFRRAAYCISRWFNGLYGTAIPAGMPSTGPVFTHAYAESATTTIVTAEHDMGTALRLGVRTASPGAGGAADARGWTFIDGGQWRMVQSCELVNATQVRIRHDARTAAPAFCEVGYCLYGERLFRGGGIYDNAGSRPAVAPLASSGPDWIFDWPVAGMFTPLVPSTTPFGGGGTVTPPVTPAPGKSVVLSVVNIGTLNEAVPNGGVAVPITVTTAATITSLTYVVYRADLSWRFDAITVPTTGSVTLLPRFFAGGDTFKVWPTGNEPAAAYTEPVVAVIPPTGRYIGGSPVTVGELVTDSAGGADFAFTIQSGGGITQLEWVMVGPAPDFFWDGFSRKITATGTDRIPTRFTRPGEFFECWDSANPSIRFRSGAVTLVAGAPTGPVLTFLNNPGTLYEPIAGAGAPWVFQVGTEGISRLGIVVVNPDYSWTTGGQVIDLPDDGAQVVTGTVRFTRSGQFPKIYDADNLARVVDGQPVTLAIAPVDTSNPDPDGLAFAKNWFKGLTLSLNPERAWAWSLPGGIAVAAAYWKSLGFGDVRLFYPWRPAYDMNGEGRTRPTKAQFARLLDAVAQYNAADMKVRLFIGDVWTIYEDIGDAAGRAEVLAHVIDCAAWIAERNFDPNLVCVGVANELGGDSDFVALQIQWHDIMRAALPGFLLACGANYWQAWSYLVSSTPWTTDKRTYWPIHIYEAHNAVGWTSIRNQLRAWSLLHGGLVIAADEWGGGYFNESSTPATWLPQLDTYFPAMEEFYTSLWAITYGTEWRWNLPNSYKLRPEFETKLKGVNAQIAINLGTEEPPPPVIITPGAGTITVPVITITLPGGSSIELPAGAQIIGLFHDLVNPSNKAAPILLRETVSNAQDDIGLVAAALLDLQQKTNEAIAYLAMNALALPVGPLANDAAAAAAGLEPGASYFDAAGVVRRRLV